MHKTGALLSDQGGCLNFSSNDPNESWNCLHLIRHIQEVSFRPRGAEIEEKSSGINYYWPLLLHRALRCLAEIFRIAWCSITPCPSLGSGLKGCRIRDELHRGTHGWKTSGFSPKKQTKAQLKLPWRTYCHVLFKCKMLILDAISFLTVN